MTARSDSTAGSEALLYGMVRRASESEPRTPPNARSANAGTAYYTAFGRFGNYSPDSADADPPSATAEFPIVRIEGYEKGYAHKKNAMMWINGPMSIHSKNTLKVSVSRARFFHSKQ
jgi:hypothetical protein